MNILVPIDFSEVTDTVLSEAIRCAKAFNASLQLLHVLQPIPQALLFEEAMPVLPFNETLETIQADREKLLKKIEDHCHAEAIKTEIFIRDGSPADTILAVAEEVNSDRIILGSHGHGALYHLVLGSVSEKVIDKASAPVLVVKC